MTPADGEIPIAGDQAAKDKAVLRRMLRDRRAAYVDALDAASRGLSFRLLPSPVLHRLPQQGVVALYHPAGHEAPTERIAHQLTDLGFMLALPRIDRVTGTMTFVRWDMDRILVPGPFRALQPDDEAEPVEPAVIIAPLVGFDASLNRLGQGGGHYDRAFARHPDALRIGLAWSAQMVDSLPADPHDMSLDMVVTEAALYEREQVREETHG